MVKKTIFLITLIFCPTLAPLHAKAQPSTNDSFDLDLDDLIEQVESLENPTESELQALVDNLVDLDDIPPAPPPPTEEDLKITVMDRLRFLWSLPFKMKLWFIKEHILHYKGRYIVIGLVGAAGCTGLGVYVYKKRKKKSSGDE